VGRYPHSNTRYVRGSIQAWSSQVLLLFFPSEPWLSVCLRTVQSLGSILHLDHTERLMVKVQILFFVFLKGKDYLSTKSYLFLVFQLSLSKYGTNFGEHVRSKNLRSFSRVRLTLGSCSKVMWGLLTSPNFAMK
jgi:hypothetical protein